MRRFLPVFVLVLASIVLSGCKVYVDSVTGKWTTELGSPKASLAPDAPCVVTSCHGLDIKCGSAGPEACTMEYQLGDFCRQYAHCAIVEGQCQLKESRLVEECISCVELCDSGLDGSDPTKAFECEQECREQLGVMERSL